MPDWSVSILCSVVSAITTIIVMVITLNHSNKQLKEQYKRDDIKFEYEQKNNEHFVESDRISQLPIFQIVEDQKTFLSIDSNYIELKLVNKGFGIAMNTHVLWDNATNRLNEDQHYIYYSSSSMSFDHSVAKPNETCELYIRRVRKNNLEQNHDIGEIYFTIANDGSLEPPNPARQSHCSGF